MTDFLPSLLGDVQSDEYFRRYCLLLTRYIDDVLYVVYRTRDYANGLNFCDEMDQLNLHFRNVGKLSNQQHEKFHCTIAGFRLDMLDNLDRWQEYVAYFDELFETTSVTLLWAYEPEHKTEYAQYLKSHDKYNSELHWLWRYDKRYQLIKRKMENPKRRNMRHKEQSEFTEEQLRQRFNDAMMSIQLWHGT